MAKCLLLDRMENVSRSRSSFFKATWIRSGISRKICNTQRTSICCEDSLFLISLDDSASTLFEHCQTCSNPMYTTRDTCVKDRIRFVTSVGDPESAHYKRVVDTEDLYKVSKNLKIMNHIFRPNAAK
mgnify:CR=1 FL=1